MQNKTKKKPGSALHAPESLTLTGLIKALKSCLTTTGAASTNPQSDLPCLTLEFFWRGDLWRCATLLSRFFFFLVKVGDSEALEVALQCLLTFSLAAVMWLLLTTLFFFPNTAQKTDFSLHRVPHHCVSSSSSSKSFFNAGLNAENLPVSICTLSAGEIHHFLFFLYSCDSVNFAVFFSPFFSCLAPQGSLRVLDDVIFSMYKSHSTTMEMITRRNL